MKKNKFICRLLSLCVLTGAALTSASIFQNVFAYPVEELVSQLKTDRGIVIREVDRKRQDRVFDNYQCLDVFKEDPHFKLFVSTFCTTPHEADSALFLRLISHVDSFYMTSNNKRIDSFKENLLEHMVSLRTAEEFRNDKYLVARFDERFHTNVKNLLRQFGNFKKTGKKIQSAAELTSDSLFWLQRCDFLILK